MPFGKFDNRHINRGLHPSQRTAVKKIVQKTINRNSETKFRLISYNGQAITDTARTPINILLQNITQGDSQTQRQGNQIIVTGLFFSLTFLYADDTNIVRLIIYMPKDITDDMATDTISVNTAIDLDKYTVLEDRKVFVDNTSHKQAKFNYKKKFNKGTRRGLQTIWHSTAGGDVTKNAIKFYVVSDSTAISDPAMSGEVRLYYKDM